MRNSGWYRHGWIGTRGKLQRGEGIHSRGGGFEQGEFPQEKCIDTYVEHLLCKLHISNGLENKEGRGEGGPNVGWAFVAEWGGKKIREINNKSL